MPMINGLIVLALLLAMGGGCAVVLKRMQARLVELQNALESSRLLLEGANNKVEQVKAQAALMSNTDPVTGLLNRHVVVERFHLSLALARRENNMLGIALLRLPGFVSLSDQHGPDTMGKLLTEIAERLRAATRETDSIGRVRDDEFAVLLPAVAGVEALASVMQKLREAMTPAVAVPGIAAPFGLDMQISAAAYPQDGENWATVVRAADERLRVGRIGR